jgi:hypothetical protein
MAFRIESVVRTLHAPARLRWQLRLSPGEAVRPVAPAKTRNMIDIHRHQ